MNVPDWVAQAIIIAPIAAGAIYLWVTREKEK